MQSHSLSRNRVVVVEDEPDVGRLIEMTVKRAGDFEVETHGESATSGPGS